MRQQRRRLTAASYEHIQNIILASDGVLGAITVGFAGERRDVVSTELEPLNRSVNALTGHGRNKRATTIDTSSMGKDKGKDKDKDKEISEPPPLSMSMDGIAHRAGGRAAAAFARVACRELGYADINGRHGAPLVTNCQGLANLLAELEQLDSSVANATADSALLLSHLCPELHGSGGTSGETTGTGGKDGAPQQQQPALCHNWLEVRDPPISDPSSTQLDWVQANAMANHKGVVLQTQSGSASASDSASATASAPASTEHVEGFGFAGPGIWKGKVGPIPESPSCSGSEDSVLRCFPHQMIMPLQPTPEPEPPQPDDKDGDNDDAIAHQGPVVGRQQWTRPCSQRILVGCSAAPTASGGTWVIGDQPVVSSSAGAMRQEEEEEEEGQGQLYMYGAKIFGDVGEAGPVNCSTGQPATELEIRTAVHELCWGTLL
jgi:hypothetical protein